MNNKLTKLIKEQREEFDNEFPSESTLTVEDVRTKLKTLNQQNTTALLEEVIKMGEWLEKDPYQGEAGHLIPPRLAYNKAIHDIKQSLQEAIDNIKK